MKYAWKSHKITVSPIKWQSTLPPFPWKRRHDMNKFNDDEGRQLFHKTDTESALTYLRKYFNIFSGVQWSFSNRLLQWVWIMHRYLLTYIYISKKKNSADFISSIFIFTLSIYRWCSTNTSKVRFIIGHASWIWPNCTLELIMTNAI
jgi:hypothetical protein